MNIHSNMQQRRQTEQERHASVHQAPIPRLPLSPLRRTAEDINTAILATVRAGAGGYFNIAERRAALKEKADWIADFDHFRRLCIGDMRQAFDESRHEGKRITHHRRRTWFTLFDYFAARIGIAGKLQITALDREGNYACTLADKDDSLEDAWAEFIRLGRRFDIMAAQLESLRCTAQTRRLREGEKGAGK